MKKLIITIVLFGLISTGAFAETLVVYFSYPMFESSQASDATSGASVTVGTNMGNNEYVASTIAQTLGADLFKNDTGDHYPADYERIFNVTQTEQRQNIRPELQQHVRNMGQYDTIILCYPIWWYRLPLPVHSFLDEYNLSGKTIYLSVVHGGSRLGGTDREIAQAEPDASISRNSLIISRNQVARSRRQIENWAKGLGL
nr:flavodoxin [uncultured Sphaerochaeta sp.]